MIELFKAGTVDFEGGTILNKVIDPIITHERNGRFDLEFKYPLDDGKYKEFENHSIFYAEVPYLGKQAFYMVDIKKHLNYVIVYAKHIMFKLNHNVTMDLESLAGGDTGQMILDKFKQSLQIPSNFNFNSNITNRHVYNQPNYNNALDVLVDGKHSILGQWGGVLIADNWNINLESRWGRDTEYLIAKRKNISDIEIQDDSETIVTRLFLTMEDEDENVISAIVDSPIIDEYPEIYGQSRDVDDESVVTRDDLIEYGNRIFENERPDLPKESFEIDVTDDVKDYMFTIDDTALVEYEDYNIFKRILVTSYEYDPVSKKYLKVYFGDKPKSMSQSVTDKVEDKIITPTLGRLESIIDKITENLADPEGGIIKLRQDNNGNINEILIVDNEDLNLAMDIWRLNIQGISHSSNGINGDFDVAMTQDGKIVADFIATGTLNAELIKSGIISNYSNNFTLDLDNGQFQFNKGVVKFTENGLRVSHPGTNQYSEMRNDGFIRKWEYGEAEYLNDVFIGQFSTASETDVPGLIEPDLIRVPLPVRFSNRNPNDFEVILSMNNINFFGSQLIDNFVHYVNTFNTVVLDFIEDSWNLSYPNPYFEVDAYQLSSYQYRTGEKRTDMNSFNFTVTVISR